MARTSTEHYRTDVLWCNHCQKVVPRLKGDRCGICTRRNKWTTRIENAYWRNLDHTLDPLPEGCIWLADGRIVDEATGEIVNAWGKVVAWKLGNLLYSTVEVAQGSLFEIESEPN